jgi:uncharacterized protein (TIGR00730 family)
MKVCVFCGASFGNAPDYQTYAKEIGVLIGSSNSTLVYGGGKVGLMGIVADSVLAHSGKVIGIIPDFLHKREVAHEGLTELHIVASMHERKMRMADLADAFIVLPGGLGTLDELVEILTWKQLSLIDKPVAVLNVKDYFDPFISLLKQMITEGFLNQKSLDELRISDNPKELFASLRN